MGDRAQLLGHREAPLFQPSLGCRDFKMKRAIEIGAGERDRQREAEARTIQLVDGDNGEGSRLRLLGSPRWIGISPEDLPLLRTSSYHSGVEASKADSISRLSAR